MSNVAVVGASPAEKRYSNKAVRFLKEKGHTAIPVAPKHERICGGDVDASLRDVPHEVDTVSMHVARRGKRRSSTRSSSSHPGA